MGLTPGRLDLRCEGVGIEGLIGWGRPASRPCRHRRLGAGRRDAARPASTSRWPAPILVVGARIDIEALSRARALGVGAIVVGGIAGRDMRQLEESEARRQAALHAAAPFAMLADRWSWPDRDRRGTSGTCSSPRRDGRRACCRAARTLVIGGDPEPLLAAAARPPGTVRIASGEWREREGRLVGLTGPRRWARGGYQPGGFVEVAGDGGGTERVSVPLATLERSLGDRHGG